MNAGKTTHKLTLALDKRADNEALAEIAARVTLGLVTAASPQQRAEMRFLEFEDADGNSHPFISALSLIVMRGKSGELRKFRNQALQKNLLCADVTRTMWESDIDGVEDAVGRDSEPEYMAVMVFGQKSVVEACTGRLSLWR